ncbi:hypothetical protein JXA34_01195 [Patescibacteria group bacterium]|nr:hypothetical protein [Patescibacteria group bacterium]
MVSHLAEHHCRLQDVLEIEKPPDFYLIWDRIPDCVERFGGQKYRGMDLYDGEAQFPRTGETQKGEFVTLSRSWVASFLLAAEHPSLTPFSYNYEKARFTESLAHEFFHKKQHEKYPEKYPNTYARYEQTRKEGDYRQYADSRLEKSANIFAHYYLETQEAEDIFERYGIKAGLVGLELRNRKRALVAKCIEELEPQIMFALGIKEKVQSLLEDKSPEEES